MKSSEATCIHTSSTKNTPAEIQFYTSKYSFLVQIPVLLFMVDWLGMLDTLTTSGIDCFAQILIERDMNP